MNPELNEVHYTEQQAADFRRARRGRNLAMLAVLVSLCVIFFAMAIVKMGHQ